MTEHKLKKQYIGVERNGTVSYGGGQQWSDSSAIRKCGCGPISGLDLLLYLSKSSVGSGILSRFPVSEDMCITENLYLEALSYMVRRFFPIVPPFGMNGLSLACGIYICFKAYKMPFQARWGVPFAKLWESIAQMLDNDIPVIFSVGPNFPLFWKKNKVSFYHRFPDGTYKKLSGAKAHFVTVTGMNDEWLRISSWGEKFYINKVEFSQYVKEHSNYLISNILYIKNK